MSASNSDAAHPPCVCVLSPDVEGLIAGCEVDFYADTQEDSLNGLFAGDHVEVVMVYFSHGRAYPGMVRDVDYNTPENAYWLSRSYWFEQIARELFGADWSTPTANPTPRRNPRPGQATVDFYSAQSLAPGQAMALIEDSRVGAWWDLLRTVTIDKPHPHPAAAILESAPAILVPLQPDPSVYEKFLATVTVDAGVYLVCWLYFYDGAERFTTEVCAYEEFPAGSHSYLSPGYGEIVYYLTHTRNYDPQQ